MSPEARHAIINATAFRLIGLHLLPKWRDGANDNERPAGAFLPDPPAYAR